MGQHGAVRTRTEKVGGLWQSATSCNGRSQPKIDQTRNGSIVQVGQWATPCSPAKMPGWVIMEATELRGSFIGSPAVSPDSLDGDGGWSSLSGLSGPTATQHKST